MLLSKSKFPEPYMRSCSSTHPPTQLFDFSTLDPYPKNGAHQGFNRCSLGFSFEGTPSASRISLFD